MKTKIILCSFMIAIFSYHTHAQVRLQSIVALDYSYGFAVGSLDKYIPGKAFYGFHCQWRYFIQRNVSLGLRLGYNNFKVILPRNVYETNRGTVSAVQTRYFTSVPFIPTAYYYMRSLHH